MLTEHQIINKFGPVSAVSGDEYKVVCPRCGKSAMWVNARKGAFYCFYCEYKGKIGGSIHPIFVESDTNVDYTGPIFPEGFRWIANRKQATEHWDYIQNRGIDPRGIRWGVYNDYCLFPVWKNSEVVYWQGRRIYPFKPKTLNPPKQRVGVGKSSVVFNLENEYGLIPRDHIIITEGIFDALTVNGVSLFGKVLSDKQAEQICAVHPKRMSIFLDSGVPLREFNKMLSVIRKYDKFVEVQYICIDDGDPNSLGWHKVNELIYRAWVR